MISSLLSALVRSNVLGGNFALVASPSVGASGAIFGTVAVRVVSHARALFVANRVFPSSGRVDRSFRPLEISV